MGDTTVFVAGRFRSIGGAHHLKVAEVELSTARATEWNPSPHLDKFADPVGGPFQPTPAPHVTINEIAVAGGRVLLGGKFDSADADLNRPALLVVSRTSGLVENWDGGFDAGSEVRELLVDGETVYVGGKFGTVGGQARANLAAFDLPTAQLKPWSPAVRLAGGAAGAHVAALAIAGGSLYVGGDFDEVGGQARKDLAEVSLQTALPAPWNPSVKDPTAGDASYVEALTVTGSLVYVGGNFGLVGEAERRGLNWERGGGWSDATAAFPDWVRVEFNGAKKVDEVAVFSLQDNYASPSEPTETLAFTKYGVTSFEAQYWEGAQWVTVPGGAVTGNNLVWRKVTFPEVTMTKVRVVVNNALGGRSRLVEVEAAGPAS